MKKILQLLLSVMFVSNMVSAQSFAINTDGSTANTSALLDVKSTAKGLLIPRMSKTERNAIASPATGLLVFQNAPDSAGFYYYDGSKWSWVAALNGNADTLAWNLRGNPGTNPATHFIGTTDNKPLLFKINNLWAGRLDSATRNVSLGLKAGQNNGTSVANIAIGDAALKTNSTGYLNVAIGDSAGYAINNSWEVVFIGNQAGKGATTTGDYSVIIGSHAADSNCVAWTTIIGNNAGRKNQRIGNTMVGSASGMRNTTGRVTFVGDNTGLYNTTGTANTFIGASAGYFNTTGSNNTVTGEGALFNNTTGSSNTAFGHQAMIFNQTGSNNVAVGQLALQANQTGSGNAAFGTWALYNNTSASSNTGIGSSALYWNTTGTSNTATGFHSLFKNSIGYYNTGTGYESLEANVDGYSNTASGFRSLYKNTNGFSNTAFGKEAGYNNLTGSANSFYGESAGYSIKHAVASALFGNYAMGYFCDTSSYNSAFGAFAGYSFSKGEKNSFFGYNTANNLSKGTENTVIGYQASVGDTADLNVTIGSFAGSKGDENVFIGHDAGKHNNNASMDGSTFVGSWAGFFKRASYSLLLGYSSTVLADGYTNASAIGAFSRVDTSNAMVLGSIGINVGIGITKPYQARLTVAASGNTVGIFGYGSTGISLQQNNPTIAYNQYRDVSAGNATRYMGNGFAWVNHMDPASGIMYWNSMPSGTTNAAGGAETNRMTLTNTGSLGLNVSPNGNGQLQFQNTIDNRKIVLWENANTSIDFYGFGINGGTLRYQIPAVGNVHGFWAGNSNIFNLFGTGNATLLGVLTQLSDARLKKNITPIDSAINDIKKVNAYTYYWKDENRDRDQQIGLLAQEVEKVFPQLVKKDAAGLLSVNYSGFVPLLIKSVQEQQQMIDNMQKRMELLEQQNKLLLQLVKIKTE